MAERRMFAKTIVLSDAFLDMPPTARCLYFTLGMFADDDGFVNSPKGIMRQCGASDDDMKILIAKKFVLLFDDGVIVIKHWRINNYLQKDRYIETKYTDDKEKLVLDENKAYKLKDNDSMYTQSMYTQDRIGKDNNILSSLRSDSMSVKQTDYDAIREMWNSLETFGITPIRKIQGKRLTLLQARLKQYEMDDFREAMDNIRMSPFLQGHNAKGWVITFDWFVRPNNFPKVLEGNYNDTERKSPKVDVFSEPKRGISGAILE